MHPSAKTGTLSVDLSFRVSWLAWCTAVAQRLSRSYVLGMLWRQYAAYGHRAGSNCIPHEFCIRRMGAGQCPGFCFFTIDQSTRVRLECVRAKPCVLLAAPTRPTVRHHVDGLRAMLADRHLCATSKQYGVVQQATLMNEHPAAVDPRYLLQMVDQAARSVTNWNQKCLLYRRYALRSHIWLPLHLLWLPLFCFNFSGPLCWCRVAWNTRGERWSGIAKRGSEATGRTQGVPFRLYRSCCKDRCVRASELDGDVLVSGHHVGLESVLEAVRGPVNGAGGKRVARQKAVVAKKPANAAIGHDSFISAKLLADMTSERNLLAQNQYCTVSLRENLLSRPQNPGH